MYIFKLSQIHRFSLCFFALRDQGGWCALSIYIHDSRVCEAGSF